MTNPGAIQSAAILLVKQIKSKVKPRANPIDFKRASREILSDAPSSHPK